MYRSGRAEVVPTMYRTAGAYPLEKSSYHSRSHIAVSEFEESTQIPYTQKRVRCKADTSTNSAPLRRVLCNYRPYLFNAPETYLFRYEISELPRAITVKLRHVIGSSLKNLGQKNMQNLGRFPQLQTLIRISPERVNIQNQIVQRQRRNYYQWSAWWACGFSGSPLSWISQSCDIYGNILTRKLTVGLSCSKMCRSVAGVSEQILAVGLSLVVLGTGTCEKVVLVQSINQ